MPIRRGSTTADQPKKKDKFYSLPRPITEEYLDKFNNLLMNEGDNPNLINLVGQLIQKEKDEFPLQIIDKYRPLTVEQKRQQDVIKKLKPLVKEGNFYIKSHRPDVALKLYKQAMTGFNDAGMDRPLLSERIAKAEVAVAEAKEYARLKKSKVYLSTEDALAVSYGVPVATINNVGGYNPYRISFLKGGAHTDDAAYLARQRAYADAEARRLRILAGVKEMVSKGWNSIKARQLLNTTDGNVEKAMANFWAAVALYDQP